MPRIFDCEDEPNQFMEMPCMCDCGKWFDLNDGYNDRNSNKVVCENCYSKQEKIADLENEIYYLELQDNTKRKVNALKKELEKINNL